MTEEPDTTTADDEDEAGDELDPELADVEVDEDVPADEVDQDG